MSGTGGQVGTMDRLVASGDPAALAYQNYRDSYGTGFAALANGVSDAMSFDEFRRVYNAMNPSDPTAGTNIWAAPPPVVAPTPQSPDAFIPQIPSLGPAPSVPGAPGAPGTPGGIGGLKGLMNPYLLYLPQGRADAATSITGAPGFGGLLGSTSGG